MREIGGFDFSKDGEGAIKKCEGIFFFLSFRTIKIFRKMERKCRGIFFSILILEIVDYRS